jgi:small-conductance mechanosensitive channel
VTQGAAPAAAAPKPAAPKPVVPTKPDETQQKLEAWKVETEQLAAGIAREGQTDRHLADLRERALRIRDDAKALIDSESPLQASLDARLKQLGPAPQAKDYEPAPVESEAVKAEREEQQKLLADVEGRIKQAQLLVLRAEEITKTIADRRRDRFTRELIERSRSSLDPSMWLEAVQSLPGTANSLRILVGDWLSLMAARGFDTALAVGSVILALVFALFAMRRRLIQVTDRDPDVVDPPRLRKSAVAAGIVALNVAVPVVGLYGIARALEVFELNPDRVSQLLDALVVGVGAAAAVYGVALALFAPAKPQWRLAAIGDGPALRLVGLSVILAATHGLGIAVNRLMSVLAAPVAEVIALAGFFAMVDAVIVMAALKAAARALAPDDEPAPAIETAGPAPSLMWRWIVPLGWIVAIAAEIGRAHV